MGKDQRPSSSNNQRQESSNEPDSARIRNIIASRRIRIKSSKINLNSDMKRRKLYNELIELPEQEDNKSDSLIRKKRKEKFQHSKFRFTHQKSSSISSR